MGAGALGGGSGDGKGFEEISESVGGRWQLVEAAIIVHRNFGGYFSTDFEKCASVSSIHI